MNRFARFAFVGLAGGAIFGAGLGVYSCTDGSHQKYPPVDTIVLLVILFAPIGLVLGIITRGAISFVIWFVKNVILQ
jgi:hypothetical protein